MTIVYMSFDEIKYEYVFDPRVAEYLCTKYNTKSYTENNKKEVMNMFQSYVGSSNFNTNNDKISTDKTTAAVMKQIKEDIIDYNRGRIKDIFNDKDTLYVFFGKDGINQHKVNVDNFFLTPKKGHLEEASKSFINRMFINVDRRQNETINEYKLLLKDNLSRIFENVNERYDRFQAMKLSKDRVEPFKRIVFFKQICNGRNQMPA